MWHFNNIPKILHLYWGTSKPLSYLRFLTVKTFLKYNPDWLIKVHYYEKNTKNITWKTQENNNSYTGDDYFSLLATLPSTKILRANFFDNSFLESAHDVHKSDFLRWFCLYQDGGFWSDFDIFYLNSITNLKENTINNKNASTLLCKYSDGKTKFEVFPIGFFGGSKRNELFLNCTEKSRGYFDPDKYECIGAKMLRHAAKKHPFTCLSDECVYPVFYKDLKTVLANNKIIPLTHTIGFHWYAGSNLMFDMENNVNLSTKEFLGNPI